jgi:hypothetical protein
MKLKATSVVQVADKDGSVTEYQPGETFNVGKADAERLTRAKHAETADDVDDVVVKEPAKDPAKEIKKA